MEVKVYYLTEAKECKKHEDKTGKLYVRSFESLEEAMAATFPKGYVFARIPVENGYHVYSGACGWEYYQKAIAGAIR